MTQSRMEGESGTQAAPSSAAAMLRVHAVDIEVLSGPDAGRRERVDRVSYIVGSGPGADLRLTDGTVSREHARLTLLPAGIRLRDEGSKNGTFIGALRISDIVVTADTVVDLGTTRIALHIEASPLDLPLSDRQTFGGAIGVSTAMRNVFATLERIAASDVTVLLEGESGVGKEVLARAIHAHSTRARGPFVAVDCGAIPAGLIEAELFGHERGAFTGADQARPGVFEYANGGTLFLDEIGELPLELQPKLLRVLEQREVRPVGARAPRSVDVRILAATNRRLAEAAQKNEFRRDLFYRLAVARVTIPPLRERTEDIAPLACAFLQASRNDAVAELPPDLEALLRSYAWPGNVRELRNVIDRYALLGMRDAGSLFDAERVHVRDASGDDELAQLPYAEARRRALDRFERSYLPRVLERAGGVVARAASLAEVARPSFYRMLQRARLTPDGADPDDEGQ